MPFRPEAELVRASGDLQQELHARARGAAETHFGRRVFLRGVVEVSNFCRENCSYCGMRRDNRGLQRYRARVEELAELIVHHRPGHITDLNIQAGEDPVAVREIVLPLVRLVRQQTALGISVCLGCLSPKHYQALQEAGASVYIMKFEMADRSRYRALHGPGDLEERLRHIRLLAEAGWHVSSGFIAGLPEQTEADLVAALQLATQLPLAGCSVSPFIPGEATPLAAAPMGSIETTLNCMALLRLLQPAWTIPAVSALNLAEPEEGYRRGLQTGANLVTINLTPSDLRGDYLLYRRDRFIMTEERILSAIEAAGLEPSSQSLVGFYSRTPARADPLPNKRPAMLGA